MSPVSTHGHKTAFLAFPQNSVLMSVEYLCRFQQYWSSMAAASSLVQVVGLVQMS